MTNSTPIISVIVPVYRAEQYIKRCVKSILNQTESNIELWLIDDGSPDKCGEICDSFAKQDSRVHVIHKKNAGVSAARNDGIQHASGKYIAFADADDYLEPNMLSCLLAVAERVLAEITICGYYIEQDGNLKKARLCCAAGKYEKTDEKQLLSKFFEKDYTGLASMCNKLYLKAFLNLNGIRVDENLQRAEDFWFNFKAFEHSVCVYVLSTPLYHYVQNEGSVMHRYRETQFEEWTNNRKRLLSIANEMGISIQLSEFYFRYVYNSILLLRDISIRSDCEKLNKILHDSFLRNAITHTKKLPLHVRMIAACIKNKCYGLTKMLLKLWSIIG